MKRGGGVLIASKANFSVNELGSRKLATRESCENWLSDFFDNREASFYKRSIMKLASNKTAHI